VKPGEAQEKRRLESCMAPVLYRIVFMILTPQRTMFAFLMTLAMPGFAADPVLVVDRGLPQVNLNNASGPVRSNVRWGWHDHGFLGDDFTIGQPGERWVIDAIRTWAVPGNSSANLAHLGDYFQDVRLHVGDRDVTPVATAQLTAGTDETSNANVRVSEATQSGALLYDDFGTALRVWQLDFQNVNVAVEGGAKVSFGVWGNGRAIPGSEGKAFMWYNHASNAALSGNRQDGADGKMLLFDAAGRSESTFNAEGNGWDKSADINVQVFAHRVDSRPAKKPR
jgi:hypothetical protein